MYRCISNVRIWRNLQHIIYESNLKILEDIHLDFNNSKFNSHVPHLDLLACLCNLLLTPRASISWNIGDLGPLYIRAWDFLTNDIQIMVIGWEVGEGLSSLYTRPWGLKGPKKLKWMKNLRGVLHGTKWIVFFYGLLNNVLDLMKHKTKGRGTN